MRVCSKKSDAHLYNPESVIETYCTPKDIDSITLHAHGEPMLNWVSPCVATLGGFPGNSHTNIEPGGLGFLSMAAVINSEKYSCLPVHSVGPWLRRLYVCAGDGLARFAMHVPINSCLIKRNTPFIMLLGLLKFPYIASRCASLFGFGSSLASDAGLPPDHVDQMETLLFDSVMSIAGDICFSLIMHADRTHDINLARSIARAKGAIENFCMSRGEVHRDDIRSVLTSVGIVSVPQGTRRHATA